MPAEKDRLNYYTEAAENVKEKVENNPQKLRNRKVCRD